MTVNHELRGEMLTGFLASANIPIELDAEQAIHPVTLHSDNRMRLLLPSFGAHRFTPLESHCGQYQMDMPVSSIHSKGLLHLKQQPVNIS